MNAYQMMISCKRIIILIIIFNFYSCKKTNINPIIDQTVQEFIPDKRVAFCNIEANRVDNKWILSGETNVVEAKDSLLARLVRLGEEVIDSIKVLPLSDFNKGVVSLSVCNIRSKPKHSSELSTQALMGTTLKVYKKKDNWYYVQTPDDYLGWVDDNAIKLMDQLSYANWSVIPKIIFTEDVGLSYKEPSLHSSRVSDLVLGNIMQFKGSKNGFIKVGYPDGRIAYVPSRDVLHMDKWTQNIEANSDNVLATANRFLGRPYLWGGTSSLGFDCSGLTKMVYAQYGYQLPRDASQQVNTGTLVDTDQSLKNLVKGDLLFFGKHKTNTNKEKITHVAIYMGEGKIIHATGDVKIESLRKGDENFNQRRYDTFIKAKRILGSENVDKIFY